jgi:hypothetical protein
MLVCVAAVGRSTGCIGRSCGVLGVCNRHTKELIYKKYTYFVCICSLCAMKGLLFHFFYGRSPRQYYIRLCWPLLPAL